MPKENGGFILRIPKNTPITKLKQIIQNNLGVSLEWYRFSTAKDSDGLGKFWRSTNETYIIAAYYHPSKKHSAIANGGTNGGGLAKIPAKGGEWAVAYSKRGFFNTSIYALSSLLE